MVDERYERLPEWAGKAHRLCAKCGRLFNGISSFDAHQTADYSLPNGQMVTCHDPAGRGHWWNYTRRAWSYSRYEGPRRIVEAAGSPEDAADDVDYTSEGSEAENAAG
jgi:hypothetical protein